MSPLASKSPSEATKQVSEASVGLSEVSAASGENSRDQSSYLYRVWTKLNVFSHLALPSFFSFLGICPFFPSPASDIRHFPTLGSC